MRIFLSYHTPDSRIADALKTAIEAKLEGSEVFVAHRDLRYGAPWQPQLSASIASADAFIILLGSKVGRWQLPEYYAAHNRAVMQPEFKLVPVLTADDVPALPFLSSIHYIKAADPAHEPHLSEIVAALKGEKAEAGQQQLWLSVNPYRGLESLREEDADFFFGRENETAAALNLLGSPVNGIVTLIGNSGVGKSSLVEAGVFAALRRQVMPTGTPWPSALNESREWATITMRPGDDPVQALVAAFMDLWFGDMTDPDRIARRNRWAKLFRDGEAQLRDIIQATFDRFEKELALPAPRRILLNINQAEELYSLAPEAAREPFSKLIAQALTDRRFAVIASIRSDYYGYHQTNAPLFDHMHRLDVRPFGAESLKRVITGPAEVLGASFESGELADFIVKGAAGQAGALPLLAFYMTDLWDRMQKRGDGTLRLTDKTEMVDVGKALTAQADRFLGEHPANIDAVKRLFTLKLARVHEEGKAVRRRVARAKLDAAEWKLIEALSDPRWRLVTTGEDSDGAYAEVAHEVLLQSWGTLVAWLEGEREFLAFKARVEQAQAAWLKAERDKRALLSGLDLIQAEQWLATRERDFDADDAAFIRASVAARDAELAAAARFRRRVQWGTAFAAIAMTILSLFAVWEWREADRREIETAEILERIAEALQHPGEAVAQAKIRSDLERCALKGNDKCLTYLGSHYLWNYPKKESDYVMAREWFEKGAAKGNADAMSSLGGLYLAGQGVPKDEGKAREWYEKAAAKGLGSAMIALGAFYEYGLGVTQDYIKARQWYEKAAAKGLGSAMIALGAFYEYGLGVTQDYIKARQWYEMALENKTYGAETDIGNLYYNGRGVPQDYAKARWWYEKTSDVRATHNLGLLYETGKGVQQDYGKALELYGKAAAFGSGDGMVALAGLYYDGHGVPQDYTKAREWLEKAAATDNSRAMASLGQLYANGNGVTQDYAKAREWYEKGAEKGDADAMAKLGALYAEGQGVQQDYAKAREWYEKGAAKEDATAMFNLGTLYWNGYGVPQDYVKAREWYEKGAAKEDATAMVNLGTLYWNGYGVPQDYVKAREWYEKGAAKEDATAMVNLGTLYWNGYGVPQDYVKAREWYEKGAAKDNAEAMTSLGILYEYGYGVPQNYGKARELYEKAATKDNANAMTDLGMLYESGKGVPQDYSKAREWYEKAAAKDYANAMVNIGILYENGKGMPQDYGKAREWYEKAAAKDNGDAMYSLGLIYENGRGVNEDDAKARGWYEKARALYDKAAANGDLLAISSLGVLYENGQGLPHDYIKAREWYEKGAAKNDAQSMNNLGLLYYYGHGVTRDYTEARGWFEKAAMVNYADAMNALGLLYQKGRGAQQDYSKAREWYERAAANGSEDAKLALEELPAAQSFYAKDYAKAANLLEELLQTVEKNEAARNGEAGSRTAAALSDAAWYQLFAKRFKAALVNSERSKELRSNVVIYAANYTYALMFLNREREARAFYMKYRGKRTARGSWEETILEDFAEFEKAGLKHPMMDEIRAAFSSAPEKK